MKLVHIGNYNPYEVDGGIEIFTLNVCRRLSYSGHEVKLLCYSLRSNQEWSYKNFKMINLFCPLKIFELPIPSLKSIRRGIREVKSADIIHIHYPSPLSAFLFSAIARYYHKKIVLSMHTHIGIDESSVQRGVFYSPLSYINNALLLKFTLKSAKRILVPSPAFLKHSKYTSDYDRVAITIPNGVDIDHFKPSNDDEAIHKKIGIKGKMVLFVGSLNSSHRQKGLKILMESMQRVISEVEDTNLVVIGDGDLKSEYAKYANESGIADHVIFTGRINHNDLPPYYSAADVFVLPTVGFESFGMVVAEAMACGTPVIGSDIGGIPYVIGDAGLLIKSGDEKELADKLLEILMNEKMADAMGKNCRERVINYFTWDITSNKILEIYNSLF